LPFEDGGEKQEPEEKIYILNEEKLPKIRSIRNDSLIMGDSEDPKLRTEQSMLQNKQSSSILQTIQGSRLNKNYPT